MITKTSLLAVLFSLWPLLLPAQQPATNRTQSPAPNDTLHATLFTTHRLISQDILRLPFRGIQNYVPLLPGVVQQNGNFHIRGSRAGETAYFVDGLAVTNRFFNSEGISIIPEAIAQVEIFTGAYGAEMGGANGGLIHTQMRTGGEHLQYGLSLESDDFAKPGKEFFNTTVFGYRNLVGTIGGPLPFGAKFFLAGEQHYLRNRQIIFLEPFRFEGLVTDALDIRQGQALPGPIAFKRNYLPNNWDQQNTLQGNLLVPLRSNLNLRLTGSYSKDQAPEGGNWPYALENYFRQRRNMRNETTTKFGAIRATHELTPKLSYHATLSWQDRFYRLFDPDFGDDWPLYADSLANAQKGYTGFRSRYFPPAAYSIIYGFSIKDPNAPNNIYRKNQQTNFTTSLDFVSRLTEKWQLKAGAALESWRIRHYAVGSISAALQLLYGASGATPRQFDNRQQRRVQLTNAGTIHFYGYDVDGKRADSGLDAPRRPRFFSSYLQNEIESGAMRLVLGARYEVFDLRMPMPADSKNPPMNLQLGWLDEARLVEQKPLHVMLPRLGASFKLGASSVAHVAFGQYAQMPPLRDLFLSPLELARNISPYLRGNLWFLSGNVPGYLLKPERSTHYEAGFSRHLTSRLHFSGIAFYKELSDQAQLGLIDTTGTEMLPLVVLRNDGAGTVKGAELSLQLRRTKRLEAQFYYTFSQAQGTSSQPKSNAGAIGYYYPYPDEQSYPQFASPLDYDQTHRGALLLDYRFEARKSGIFNGAGLTALLTFNNGHPYTQEFRRYFGSVNVWNWAVTSLLDPRAEQAIEAPNSSRTLVVFNVDLQVGKTVALGRGQVEFYVNVLNVFNRKHIVNVYPLTGEARVDGALQNEFIADYFAPMPRFTEFYNAINRDNRWAYMRATGNDLFGAPRQIRVGVKLEM